MSDILIKGMEMPKNCGECFACKAELSPEKKVIYVCCFTREEYGFNGNRMDDCPLVPVPDHRRLIEAEPLVNFIVDGLNSGEFGYDQIKVLTEIQYAPTIIEAEEGIK